MKTSALQLKKRKENTEKQWLFFYMLLQMREKSSEISNKALYGDLNSMWFHHIYPKSKYPELRFCPENIIIVTPDEHTEIEAGINYEEVIKRKKFIAENFEELVKSSRQYVDEYLNPIYDHAKQNTDFFKKGHKTVAKNKINDKKNE